MSFIVYLCQLREGSSKFSNRQNRDKIGYHVCGDWMVILDPDLYNNLTYVALPSKIVQSCVSSHPNSSTFCDMIKHQIPDTTGSQKVLSIHLCLHFDFIKNNC